MYRIALLYITCLPLHLLPAQITDWERESDPDEAMQVFTREVGEERLIEVKMVLEIEASIEEIMETVHNINSYTTWIYRCRKAELVMRDSQKYAYRTVIKMPIMMKDREILAKVTESWCTKGKVFSREIESAPHLLPANKDLERIAFYESSWTMEPVTPQQTRLIITALSDGSKGLPNWIAKKLIVSGPTQTLRQLKQHVEAK